MVACSNSGPATTAASSPQANQPTASSPQVNHPTASPSISPIITENTSGPAWGVLFDQPSTCQPNCTPNGSYSVYLISTNSTLVAAAQAQGPAPVSCAPGQPGMVPLPISTSNKRVYFLDASGDINYLGPNGDQGVATKVPVGNGRRSMFSVSPDDTRIAVVVADFSSNGASTKLYVEDLNGGGNHIDTFSESGANTLWPLGWHGGNSYIVLAKVPSCVPAGGLGPGQTELHLVDPATADRKYTIGNSGCTLTLVPVPAGVPCQRTDGYVTILDWTGREARPGYTEAEPQVPMYLAPNGGRLAFSPRDGITAIEGTSMELHMVACGWIDNTHIFSGGGGSAVAQVGDYTTGMIGGVAAQGQCAGRIPGGL